MDDRSVDVDQLIRCQSSLGEAIVDPSRWRGLLEELCLIVGAEGGSIRQNGVRTPNVPYTRSMEDLTKIYFREGWNSHDTRLIKLQRLKLRQRAFHDFAVFGTDELQGLFRKDPFFNDFLGRGGLRWSAWIQFQSGKNPWLMGFQRTDKQGPFSEGDIVHLWSLSGALTEAANLSAAVGHAALAGIFDALDLIQKPAIALASSGQVMRANNAAEASFDVDFSVRNGKLVVSDSRARKQLETIISRIPGSFDIEPLTAAPVPIIRNGKPPLILRLLSIPAAARSPFLGARALLVFSDSSRAEAPSPELFQLGFHLTPAQAKLVARLFVGESLDDIAQSSGISRETIRNHLKAVFAKTGTGRQGELIALLHRFLGS